MQQIKQQTTIEEFFIKNNIEYLSLIENSSLDISDKNIKINSFNHLTNKNEFNIINKIIRKKDSKIYKFIIANNIIKVTGEHKFFVKNLDNSKGHYLDAKIIFTTFKNYNYFLFNGIGWDKIDSIEINKNIVPIYDFEIENVHNYYSNNYLSHNTLFGSPETTTGGEALKFYASIRLDVRKSTQIKDNEGQATGNLTKVKVIKNKVAPPFKTAEFDIEFGIGINKQGEIIDLGTELEIITKAGSWYSYNEMKIGQGKNSVVEFLRDNPELAIEIENKIKEMING